MPVAVVALAAGSFAAGASAFAAASTIAGMVAAGATMVGSALTIVGTITGNQKLTKIGAIVGIAGSLGTAFMSTASAGAEAAASAAGDTAGTAAADASGAAAGDTLTTVPVAAPGGIEALGDTATGGMLDAASSSTAATGASSGGMIDAAAQAGQGAASAADPLAQTMTDTTSAFKAGSTATGQAVGNAFDATSTAAGQAGNINAFQAPTTGGMLGSIEAFPGAIDAAGAATSTPGILDTVQAWAKTNPELAKMALSGVGTVAGNLVPSAKDKAMMDAYKAQTEAANRRALWGSGRIK